MLQKLIRKEQFKKLQKLNLIGNNIADRFTSLSKTKSKETKNEKLEIYITPEKRQQIIDDLILF